jgi:hypothetical protein
VERATEPCRFTGRPNSLADSDVKRFAVRAPKKKKKCCLLVLNSVTSPQWWIRQQHLRANQGRHEPMIGAMVMGRDKFSGKPVDWEDVNLKYLAGTADLCIHYGRTKDGKIEDRELNRLWGWVDADFATDLDTHRLHTGYVIMMNDGPISWKSVNQKSVSLSTAEIEWYSASEVGKELLYLRIIMREFGFPQLGPMYLYLYEDSRAVIAMAENPSNRKRDTLIRVSISSTNLSKMASSSWCSAEPTRW